MLVETVCDSETDGVKEIRVLVAITDALSVCVPVQVVGAPWISTQSEPNEGIKRSTPIKIKR